MVSLIETLVKFICGFNEKIGNLFYLLNPQSLKVRNVDLLRGITFHIQEHRERFSRLGLRDSLEEILGNDVSRSLLFHRSECESRSQN